MNNTAIGTFGTILLSTSLISRRLMNTAINLPSVDHLLQGDTPTELDCSCEDGPLDEPEVSERPPYGFKDRDDMGSEEEFIVSNIMNGYKKQAVPMKDGVTVDVEILINDITSLSEVDSEFELDIFFSEIWLDPALNYSYLNDLTLTNFTLGLEYLEKLWQPNICIVNSKSTIIHKSPSPNVFLIIYADGKVWRNCRMKVKAPCHIDLKTFPFDFQYCSLTFESYTFNSRSVRLKWMSDSPAISYVKKIELPDFFMSRHVMEHNRILYPNGFWDQLKVTFFFERRYGFFILQAYAPTYMIIFVAWINFWMDPLELGTRATLSISAFLAMTFQFGTVVTNMPRVSYIKAIDIWMLGSIAFLFFALAELAVISFMIRTDRPEKLRKAREMEEAEINQSASTEFNGNPHRSASCKTVSMPLEHGGSISARNRRAAQKKSLAVAPSFHVLSMSPKLPVENKDREQRLKNRNNQSDNSPPPWPQSISLTSEYFPLSVSYDERMTCMHVKYMTSFALWGSNVMHRLLNSWTPYEIDKACLIAYPPVFLAFNIVYWFYYIGSSPMKLDASQFSGNFTVVNL